MMSSCRGAASCAAVLLLLRSLSADAPSTAAAYAKLRAAEDKAGDKSKASLWQLIFGGSDSSTDGDTIKAAAGKARQRSLHKAKPLVTAAA